METKTKGNGINNSIKGMCAARKKILRLCRPFWRVNRINYLRLVGKNKIDFEYQFHQFMLNGNQLNKL